MLTNTRTVGRARSVSSVNDPAVPRTAASSNSGAGVPRGRPGGASAARAASSSDSQTAPVRPQLRDRDRQHRGEHGRRHQRDLGSVQASERAVDARPWSRDDDHRRRDREHRVADQRRASRRLRMDLAKAMTVGSFPSRHRSRHAAAEREQQQQSADRAPPRGGPEQKRDRHRKLGNREHDAAEPGGTSRHPELLQRAARTAEIQQLADRGDDEHHREQCTGCSGAPHPRLRIIRRSHRRARGR